MAQGINFLIYAQTGSDATTGDPIFTKLGGQRNGTLNRDVETIDTTTKDSGGWMENEYGNGSWSIDGDGLLVESDTAYTTLETSFVNKSYVLVKFETPSGSVYKGDALVTSFPIEAPYDDSASYSITLTGKGSLTKV